MGIDRKEIGRINQKAAGNFQQNRFEDKSRKKLTKLSYNEEKWSQNNTIA